jgi:uncharacterized protein
MDRIAAVAPLGIGLAYQPALRPYIEEKRDTFDYVETVPDLLWTDRGIHQEPRYLDDEEGLAFLRRAADGRPVVPHGIGLSIGTAHRFNRGHLDQMEKWFRWFGFPWHSEHLAYNLAEHGIDEMNVGVTLPLPRDLATLEALAPRIAEVQRRLPIPFLLENNVYFFEMPGEEMTDAEFLNALCHGTGCGLLLDLHNVYCNARNHRQNPFRLLGELDLSRVLEIHVAGGMEHEGWWLDAHCGPMPEPVWELLDYALPRCPNLAAVTFEMLGSWYVEVGSERLAAELLGLRELWCRYRPMPALVEAVA